jgi:4-amino-4-deoxy-L-arabinose transferase-like glycosyltransferase
MASRLGAAVTIAEPRRRWELDALSVFVLAIAARLAFVAAATGSFDPANLRSDPFDYHDYAVHLADQGRFVDGTGHLALRMPGYPAFLALLYLAFGHGSLWPVAIAQSLLGAFACLALFAVARKLYGEPWGLLCGIAAALSYDLIAPSGRILSESLASPLVCFFFAAWFLPSRRPYLWAALSGAVLGALVLTRPEFGPFAAAFFLLAPRWAKAPMWRPGHAALGLGVLAVALSPWIVRNAIVFRRFVPGCLDGPISLYRGLALPLQDMKDRPVAKESWPAGRGEMEISSIYMDRYKNVLRTTPFLKILRVYALNDAAMFYPFLPQFDGTYMLFVPLWLYALAKWRQFPELRPVWLMLGFYLIAHLFFGPESRFRQAITGPLLLAAAAGASGAWRRWGKKLAPWAAAYAAADIAVWIFAPQARQGVLWLKRALLGLDRG